MNLAWLSPAVKPNFVSVPVSPEDPLLLLKARLDWEALLEVFTIAMRLAGRNVDGFRRGRRTDVIFWLPVVILEILLGKNSREMELLLADSARARVFVNFKNSQVMQLRDHSSIARMRLALATSGGYEKINELVVHHAQSLGFTDAETLSADTTAQQANIAYPNEPGILAMGAKSVLGITRQLQQAGRKKLGDLAESAKKLLSKAKEYNLFAKGPEKRTAVLQQMVKIATQLTAHGKAVQTRISLLASRKMHGLAGRLEHITNGLDVLLPQIQQWMATGIVAKDKILHLGMNKMRSMLRHKPGKKANLASNISSPCSQVGTCSAKKSRHAQQRLAWSPLL